jgi:DNA-binding MurR/RpiR family transcriptional regulator
MTVGSSDGHDKLERRIATHFDALTPKQQVLARLILDNRYMASFASAAEIGEKVQASAATVVRFCQTLGYQGLPDLQAAIRAELPSYVTAVERLERRNAVASADGDVLQRAFSIDIRNLERTAEVLASAPYRQAVDALAGAREVMVLAGGLVTAPAVFLAYSLRVIGMQARAVLEGDVAQVVDLARVGTEDVVVAIGIWRYIASTVNALTWVKQTGARTIAITDSIVSPLARQADIALETATEGVAHSQSVTAMMTLLNALIADVALQDPERTRLALLRVDKQFKEQGLVIQ